MNTDMDRKECAAHHYACDCREKAFRELLLETIREHADPASLYYNNCDTAPCAWCEKAMELIGAKTKTPSG